MNKIYSLIWNAALSRWVITSELSSKQKKGSARKTMLKGFSALLLTSAASSAFAGTCIQQDALGTNSVMGSGAGAPATCGPFSIAIGAGSGATANNFGIAIGDAANSTGDNSVALGRQSNATGNGGTAVGQGSSATGIEGTALGIGTNAGNTSSVAIGSNAQSTGVGSVAIGGNTVATSQSFASDGIAIGGQSIVDAASTSGIAIGRAATVNNTYGIAMGDGTTAGNSGIALGRNAQATGTSSISIGTGNTVSGNNSGAFGDPSTVSGTDSYSFGNNNTVNANNAFALGNNITIATGLDGAVVLGNNSTVAASNPTATGTINGTTFNFAGGAPAAGGVVSVGSVGGERQITNLAAGRLSATSTDAVNGSQLFATNQAVSSLGGTTTALGNSLTTQLGGGTTYNPATGALSGFSVNLKPVSNTGVVGAAFAQPSVAAAFNQLNTNVDNTANIAVKYDAVGGNTITLGATGGAGATAPVKITNLEAATLNNTSSDAVNGSQLFATNQSMTALGGTTTALGNGTANSLGGGATYNTTTGALSGFASNINAVSNTGAVGAATAHNTVSDALDALNTNVNNTANVAVKYDAVGGNTITLGATGGAGATAPVKITNLEAATLNNTSSDAVNGSQLFATNQSITALGSNSTSLGNSVAANLGGGSSYNATTGAVGGFGSSINSVSNTGSVNTTAAVKTTVSDALDDLNTNITNTANVAVKYDSVGDNTITLGATGGAGATAPVKITNLTSGVVSSTSTDAVNGSQLFATNTQISNIINNGAGVKYFHSNSTLADSTATGTNSIAMGPDANAAADDSVALGNGANASMANSIALGSGSVTNVGAQSNYNAYRLSAAQTSIGEVGIGSASGNRKITGLAAGSNDNDAVNVAQLTAVGNQVDQNTNDLVVLGGRVTTVEQVVNNLSAGGGVKYFHTNSTANDSVAAGQNAVAVGPNAQATGDNTVAMGNNASAQAAGSVALGSGAADNGRGAESYTGKYSNVANNSVGTVSVGNAATGDTRTLSNVADGNQATDAVNVRQLDGAVAESKKYTDTSIANLNTSMGNVDGRISTTEQSVSNLQAGTDGMLQVNNTAQAAKPKPTGVNSLAAGAGAAAAGKNATALGNGAVANNSNSVALGNGSVTDRDNTVSVGSVGNERQIANVATGTRDTDAVNVGQLNNSLANSTNNANSYTDNKFNQLSGDLDKQKKVLSAGIAGAMAMASLPQPYEPGANMMALGGASFHGESALSLGASHLSENGRWVTKAQINTNTQNNVGWGVGVGYQF